MTHNEVKAILHHENRFLAEYTNNLGDDYRIWFIGTAENIVGVLKAFNKTEFLKIIDNEDELVLTLYDGTFDWYVDNDLRQEITMLMRKAIENPTVTYACDYVTEEDYANYCRNER